MGKIGELLGIPLGWIMYWIYQVVKNYGIALILFTLLSKLIVLPVSYKQQLGTVRMQALNPKLNKIKKQFANNPQKLQEEQQKLYQQEGVNPMGSCLPLVITMVILYGIFDVVNRPLSHILRISSDVIEKAKTIIIDSGVAEKTLKSRPELIILKEVKANPSQFNELGKEFVDKITGFKNTFLGVDLGAIPTIKPETWSNAAIALIMIPIVSGIVQLIYTVYSQYKTKQMNPDMAKAQGAGCMNVMLYGMPLFSVWLAFTVPAGVGFYWIWSSVFAFIQTYFLYMYFTPKRMEVINVKLKEQSKNKKPGFMQRMMDQQNEMMKQQNGENSRVDYDTDTDGMSRSEKQNYNRQLINEARKRMAEKYGEEYKEDEDQKK